MKHITDSTDGRRRTAREAADGRGIDDKGDGRRRTAREPADGRGIDDIITPEY